MSNKPLISIIMGIYNCADTLDEAINSILAQTYTNWQMIMCDDCSVDDTYKVAEKYQKKYPNKFILIRNEKNMGLNFTLNHCLKYAKGKYIARMDGDDISLKDRFEAELSFLETHPEYAIVSGEMEYFNSAGVFGKSNANGEPLPKDFVHGTPFCHAPCMVRREAYEAVGGYSVDNKLIRAEDFHLWIKMYKKGFKGYNLQRVIYQMRDGESAVSRRVFKYRLNEAYVISLAVKELKLPVYNYMYALVPVIKGLIPQRLYVILHERKLRN